MIKSDKKDKSDKDLAFVVHSSDLQSFVYTVILLPNACLPKPGYVNTSSYLMEDGPNSG